MKTLSKDQCRAIKAELDSNSIDWKAVAREIAEESQDFEVDGYRFIAESAIDQIAIDSYIDEPYILGCFVSSFIADNSSLSYDIIEALQSAEKFEAIGQHLIDEEEAEDMILEACRIDGYGHMLNSYDGGTEEGLLHLGYYYFRVD